MNRITALAEYIYPYKKIADIGCDHGYLIKEAIENYDIEFAQAIDNKKGPLAAAKNNLKAYNDKIVFSLSDGLTNLHPSVEVVVIAGMGGHLIKEILETGYKKLKNVKRIITQPNKDSYQIRKYATQIGYKIASEKIIEEESIFYEIIVLEKGEKKYSDTELFFGPFLMEEKSPIFLKKWKKEQKRLNKIDNKIPKAKAKEIMEKLNLEDEVED